MMCPEIVSCSELLLHLASSPGPSLPLLRRGLGGEAIAATCFWDTKECSEIFFVSSGTILLDHKIHTTLWRLFWVNFFSHFVLQASHSYCKWH